MSQPSKATLAQQGVHAGNFGALQDVIVWNVVLPADSEDALEALHVEGIKLALLPHVGAPGLTSIG